MAQKLSIFLIILFFSAAAFSQTRPTAPVQVGGAYSQTTTAPAKLSKEDLEKEVNIMKEDFSKRDYAAVIKRINTLKSKGENDYRFNLYLAQAFEGLGRLDDALYYAGEAIAEDPKDARGFIIRASVYVQKKDWENAKIDLEKTIAREGKPSAKTLSVKRAIEAQTPKISRAELKKQEVEKAKKEKTSRLRWVLIYIVAFLVVLLGFWFLRKNNEESGLPVKRKGRKVDIKEQYNFIRQIGEGGMGKVYEAYDNALKRRVAIKRVRPELVRSDYVRGQFLSEARMVALLRHPSIVEIYTVIETDNSLYLVFEYVEGQTLETRLDIDGYIPFSEAKVVFESVCSGLQYAHSQDIIHCDLKPGNIMICDDGPAKVMDFGVAKKVTEGEVGARTVAGTPAYMAPEQQKGFMKKQSDVYSLGVCLYEALVGQVPWSVEGFDIANKKIVPPSKIAPNIPTEVDKLLEKSLLEDPKARVQSIEEFWSILKAITPLENTYQPSQHAK